MEFAKGIQILFDFFSIGFGNGQGLDDAGTQPFAEFVVPILDERTGTYDNDSFRRRRTVAGNPRLEEGPNQRDRLKGFSLEEFICVVSVNRRDETTNAITTEGRSPPHVPIPYRPPKYNHSLEIP